jgi:hypothetical protein
MVAGGMTRAAAFIVVFYVAALQFGKGDGGVPHVRSLTATESLLLG